MMNIGKQLQKFNELTNFAGLQYSTECYKPLRSSEIQKSEKHVSKVINVLEDEYLNPFGLDLDPTELYNLSAGVPKEDGVKELLEINQSGNAAVNEFLANRTLTSEKKFHDPITRVKIPTFQEHYVKIKKGGSEKVIQANREVLSKLLSLSAKFGNQSTSSMLLHIRYTLIL